MQLSEQVAHSFQVLVAAIKLAVFYLQTHPLAHYMIITFVLVLALLLLLISIKKKSVTETLPPAETISLPNDMQAIAGDDLIATQLDLAKAYIEMDQKELARPILQEALKQGSATQQQEAQQLLLKTL
jgi:FimV-like protein